MPGQVRFYPPLTFPTHPVPPATPMFVLAPNGYFHSVHYFNYIYYLRKIPQLHSRAILAGGNPLLIISFATIVIYRQPTIHNNATKYQTMTSCAHIFLLRKATRMPPAPSSRRQLPQGSSPHHYLPPHPKQVQAQKHKAHKRQNPQSQHIRLYTPSHWHLSHKPNAFLDGAMETVWQHTGLAPSCGKRTRQLWNLL